MAELQPELCMVAWIIAEKGQKKFFPQAAT
jgi:hypothetical protein